MMKGMGDFISTLMVVCAIAVPLGMWKLVEIIIWVCRHVHVSF